MPIFVKSKYHSSMQDPGVTSNADVPFKRLEDRAFNDQTNLKNISNSFLTKQLIDINSQNFIDDGLLDIGYLYCEFTYLSEDVKYLSENEQDLLSTIDTTSKIGKDLVSNVLVLKQENIETKFSYYTRIYPCRYINKIYYNLADKSNCQKQYNISQSANINSIYFNYSEAKLISSYIIPSDGSTPFYRNLVVINKNSSINYREDFSSNFYESAGVYYADASQNPLYLNIIENFLPFLVLKGDAAQSKMNVIHGPVYNSLDSNYGGGVWSLSNYANVKSFDWEAPILSYITCRVSQNGQRDGYAQIVYDGNFIGSFYDPQICGLNAVSRFMHIIPQTNGELLYLYNDFTTLTSYLVDIYSYNFRYIKYRQGTSFYSFKDNGSLASQTVFYSSEQIDFSKYGAIKEDKNGVNGISLFFVAYENSETEGSVLNYELFVPVKAQIPKVVSITPNEDLSQVTVTTNYASNLSYSLGNEAFQDIAVTNDTTDGLNQTTTISLGQTSKIKVKAYNYFYTLDIQTKNLYISDVLIYEKNFTPQLDTLTFKIQNASTSADQTLYIDDGSGDSALFFSFTDCQAQSFLNYYLLANYSDTFDFKFLFTYTLGSRISYVKLSIGNIVQKTLASSVGVVVSRKTLLSNIGEDGKVNINLILVSNLNDEYVFTIPFRFINTSSSAPIIGSISNKQINLTNDGKASISFSFTHNYSRSLEISVDSLFSKKLDYKGYNILQPYFSAGTTSTENIITDSFDLGGADSVNITVVGKNFNTAGNEQEGSSSSSVAINVKQLNLDTPGTLIFYESDQSTLAEKIIKGNTYYAFLQLKDKFGIDINTANYAEYIDVDSIIVKAIESTDANIDIDDFVSVTDVGGYFYEIKIQTNSKFNDAQFTIEAVYNSNIN